MEEGVVNQVRYMEFSAVRQRESGERKRVMRAILFNGVNGDINLRLTRKKTLCLTICNQLGIKKNVAKIATARPKSPLEYRDK